MCIRDRFKPTAGNVVVHGSIAPLIELGAGFDMDLTARENIYLNGTVLGLTPKYIDEKFDEIVDFSELREFLDVPLKNYSSGMVARIAFAIATITKPDVLIADEILSVGDFMFQEKCEERMRQLMSGGTTVLLVSHSIGQIERMCDHVTWLEKGRVKMQGEAAEVLSLIHISQSGPAKTLFIFVSTRSTVLRAFGGVYGQHHHQAVQCVGAVGNVQHVGVRPVQ